MRRVVALFRFGRRCSDAPMAREPHLKTHTVTDPTRSISRNISKCSSTTHTWQEDQGTRELQNPVQHRCCAVQPTGKSATVVDNRGSYTMVLVGSGRRTTSGMRCSLEHKTREPRHDSRVGPERVGTHAHVVTVLWCSTAIGCNVFTRVKFASKQDALIIRILVVTCVVTDEHHLHGAHTTVVSSCAKCNDGIFFFFGAVQES